MAETPEKSVIGEVAYVEPAWVRIEPPELPLYPQAGVVTRPEYEFEKVQPAAFELKSHRVPAPLPVRTLFSTNVPLRTDEL